MSAEKFDLYENFGEAMKYVFQCQLIISLLQEEIDSKEEQIESKRVHIENLEENLVRMPFELAASKAVERTSIDC